MCIIIGRLTGKHGIILQLRNKNNIVKIHICSMVSYSTSVFIPFTLNNVTYVRSTDVTAVKLEGTVLIAESY